MAYFTVDPNLEKKFNRSVSLVTWSLNEELLIEDFLDRAFKLLEESVEDFEVVFVDDCSTDKSPAILASYAAKEPRLKIITNTTNLNVGLSCRRAVEAASKEFVFWQTVDWSYDIKNLRIFLELLNHYDVVQGIRPVPERLLSHIPVIRSVYRAKGRSDTLHKAFISLSNYYLLRILFKIPFHDFQNVTFYPTSLVQSLDLVGNTSFVNPEMLIKAFHKKSRFIEVPIHFIPRKVGKAKGTHLNVVLRSVKDIITNWLIWGRGIKIDKIEKVTRLQRVATPFHIKDEVLPLIVPLFKEFR
jgi:glycosyltransferase involved in cell wall biosynthesis